MVSSTALCSQAYVTELQTLYAMPLVGFRIPVREGAWAIPLCLSGVFPDNSGDHPDDTGCDWKAFLITRAVWFSAEQAQFCWRGFKGRLSL